MFKEPEKKEPCTLDKHNSRSLKIRGHGGVSIKFEDGDFLRYQKFSISIAENL